MRDRLLTSSEAPWFLRTLSVTLIGDVARAATGSNMGYSCRHGEHGHEDGSQSEDKMYSQKVVVRLKSRVQAACVPVCVSDDVA